MGTVIGGIVSGITGGIRAVRYNKAVTTQALKEGLEVVPPTRDIWTGKLKSPPTLPGGTSYGWKEWNTVDPDIESSFGESVTVHAEKVSVQTDYTFTKSAAKHYKLPPNATSPNRPYMASNMFINEIRASGVGVPDVSYPGGNGMNWKVPGVYNGSNGIWELGLDTKTNIVYHFLFNSKQP